ncbi:MAG TPA: NAD-dependent epimerase/dehydratase family protein [Tepidisphaeraceae bacterium]|nr:NAD-dependent epimerase/dehydratase family protein [Tepidisphaeraceae bacterium]
MKRYLVTGGAGFIGSHLVERLLAEGNSVTALDNFSTGQKRFIENTANSGNFRLIEGDILDPDKLDAAVKGQQAVIHLCANADVRFGFNHPERDLRQNTVATFNLLEAMRGAGVKEIAFASSGSVYGEPGVFPTPENCPFPVQTSLYAASKLAGEGMISAYAAGYGMTAWIFRFVSILGERYSHGHVFDFLRKLRKDPATIEVLGNGKQRKSYLYVQDCIGAILTAMEKAPQPVNIFNLGAEEYCTVDQSLDWICAELGLSPRRAYTGGQRGWIGDSPFIFLDTARIRSLGWKPAVSIQEGVRRTVRYLRDNPWLLENRD